MHTFFASFKMKLGQIDFVFIRISVIYLVVEYNTKEEWRLTQRDSRQRQGQRLVHLKTFIRLVTSNFYDNIL